MEKVTELVVKLFAKRVEGYFGPILIGKTIKGRGEVKVRLIEETFIEIDGMSYLMKYFNPRKKNDWFDLTKYFEQRVKNQEIKKINFASSFLVDEVYIICTLGNGATVELATGYDATTNTFHKIIDELLTEEEKKFFVLLKYVYISILSAVKGGNLTFENKSAIYRRLLILLNLEDKFEYQLSDFYKLEKINKLFEPVHIDAIETVSAIERIIYE